MESIDSGVDIGNDSNDSTQSETKSISTLNEKVFCPERGIAYLPIFKVDINDLVTVKLPSLKRRVKGRPTTVWHGLVPYSPAYIQERRLRTAVITNDVYGLKELLEKGVSPNCRDDLKRSPLHLAASRGYTEIVKLLLDYGAKTNFKDCAENTPLHLAAISHRLEVITLLLKAGAKVLDTDGRGYNPLQLAQSTLRLLQNDNGADMTVIKMEVQKIIDMLLVYLQKEKNLAIQINDITELSSRISVSNNTNQVKDDLKELLENIDKLSLC